MSLPVAEHPLVVRTDFSDDAVWDRICGEITRPRTELMFRANVEFVNDRRFAGLPADQLAGFAPPSHTFLFVVDAATVASPEFPILVVDYFEPPIRTLRVIPAEMWSVENNLSLGNMDFEDFAGSADPDGVFRGY